MSTFFCWVDFLSSVFSSTWNKYYFICLKLLIIVLWRLSSWIIWFCLAFVVHLCWFFCSQVEDRQGDIFCPVSLNSQVIWCHFLGYSPQCQHILIFSCTGDNVRKEMFIELGGASITAHSKGSSGDNDFRVLTLDSACLHWLHCGIAVTQCRFVWSLILLTSTVWFWVDWSQVPLDQLLFTVHSVVLIPPPPATSTYLWIDLFKSVSLMQF